MNKIARYQKLSSDFGLGKLPTLNLIAKMIVSNYLLDIGPEEFCLYRFDEKKLSEWRNYLTKWDMGKVQTTLNLTEYREQVHNKLLFYSECLRRDIPTPRIFAVASLGSDGTPYEDFCSQHQIRCLTSEGDVGSFLQEMKPGAAYIFKRISGSHGRGIFEIKRVADALRINNEETISESAVAKLCMTPGKANEGDAYIVQEPLHPHAGLTEIMPAGRLGTVRVVTFRDGNNVHVPFAVLKIPREFNVSDNFSAGTSGNFLADVDLSTGSITHVFSVRENTLIAKEVYAHPDTGASFSDCKVPLWQSVIDSATSAARAFADLRTVGWDIAITNDGVQVLEGNWYYDVNIVQIAKQQGIKHLVSQYAA